jgi:DNA-binding GntR family transcriptional regulator
VAGVTRSMLRDQIREVLLERILDGHYQPGARIVETQVASEFDVSQAPVREALRELEILGMVTSEPYRGARVRKVTPRQLAEIYPVRAAIEEVAAIAATPVLKDDTAGLEAVLDEMRAAAAAGDRHGLLAADVRFHRLIVEASGNATLQQVWRSLHIEARTLITLLGDTTRLQDVAESHLPVLEAIRSGDPKRAGRALRRHVEQFASWIPVE